MQDIVTSTGVPGNIAYEQVVEVHIGNPDFVYAALFSQPRFTLGSFRKCLEMLYFEYTGGRKLEITLHGKPFVATYKCAEEKLMEGRSSNFEAIYMIGLFIFKKFFSNSDFLLTFFYLCFSCIR
jgi:hypothetical protein